MAVPIYKTAAMLIVLAGLGSYAYFYESKQPAPPPPGTQKQEKILTFENDDLAQFTISDAAGQTVTIKKQAKDKSQWEIASPALGPADLSRMNTVVDRLKDWTANRKLIDAPTADDLKAFGLADSKAVWKPTWVGGESKPKEILIGGKNPEGYAYYVQTKPDGVVYLADSYSIDEMLRLVAEPPKATPTPAPTPTPVPSAPPTVKAVPAPAASK